MTKQSAVKTAPNPAIGIKDESSIRGFLLQRGIQAIQLQAAVIPAITDESLPITEAKFSEQTTSTRKTENIRKTQWINHVNYGWRKDTDLITILTPSERSQIEFITFKKYLLFHPLEDFLEATKDYDLPYMNGDSDE